MSYSPLLPVHIAAGVVGILSGTAALCFRKGSPRHAQAGRVFVAAMLTMAACAVYLAVLKHQPSNIGGGILTFYLIGTAWLTARRKDGETSRYDWAVLLIPLALGSLTILSGYEIVRGRQEAIGGAPVGMNFFMGSVMLLSAAGDVRMLVGGGVSGTQRIVRHLWRMCFGLFIAAGSFFLGQGAKVFPSFILRSGVLIIPAVLPLFLLIFWVLRVRITNAFGRRPAPSGGGV
jgi:uncharacterized membrane protein